MVFTRSEKPNILRSISSLRSVPSFASETINTFVYLKSKQATVKRFQSFQCSPLSYPLKEDPPVFVPSTPLSSRRSTV